MNKLLSAVGFVEKNAQALEENERESNVSPSNLNFLTKFTNAVVSCKYAGFQTIPDSAFQLYMSSLNILQKLKIENSVEMEVRIYS